MGRLYQQMQHEEYHLIKQEKLNLLKNNSYDDPDGIIITLKSINYNKSKDSGNIDILAALPHNSSFKNAKTLSLNLELYK